MRINYLTAENIGQEFYVFCLDVGNTSRINRHVPVTKIKVEKSQYGGVSLISDKGEIEFWTRSGTCQIYTTLEEAQTEYEITKQKAITTLLKEIDKINHLIEKIRKL